MNENVFLFFLFLFLGNGEWRGHFTKTSELIHLNGMQLLKRLKPIRRNEKKKARSSYVREEEEEEKRVCVVVARYWVKQKESFDSDFGGNMTRPFQFYLPPIWLLRELKKKIGGVGRGRRPVSFQRDQSFVKECPSLLWTIIIWFTPCG